MTRNKSPAVDFESAFRYINDVLSIYNNQFHTFDVSQSLSYQSSTSASYIDILLKLDTNSKSTTQLYDKRDNSSFSISIVLLNYVAIFQFHLYMVSREDPGEKRSSKSPSVSYEATEWGRSLG